MVKGRKKQRKNISKRLKTMVWNHRIGLSLGTSLCPCCGDQDITQSDFDCGHIIAESNKGTLSMNNLIPICRQCNLCMHSMNMRKFMLQQFNRKLSQIIKDLRAKKIYYTSILKSLRSKKTKSKKVEDIAGIILSNDISSG